MVNTAHERSFILSVGAAHAFSGTPNPDPECSGTGINCYSNGPHFSHCTLQVLLIALLYHPTAIDLGSHPWPLKLAGRLLKRIIMSHCNNNRGYLNFHLPLLCMDTQWIYPHHYFYTHTQKKCTCSPHGIQDYHRLLVGGEEKWQWIILWPHLVHYPPEQSTRFCALRFLSLPRCMAHAPSMAPIALKA